MSPETVNTCSKESGQNDQMKIATCEDPQSQSSPTSRIILPQLGLTTTLVGSLKRQRSRSRGPVNPSCTLHSLQRVGGGDNMMPAIIHIDRPCSQLHVTAVDMYKDHGCIRCNFQNNYITIILYLCPKVQHHTVQCVYS